MPRPPETPDVKASKGLAYILRHGAEKEGLHIRSDGYIKLADVLARPKMRDVDVEMVLRLVEDNAKKRFELFYGFDPSPPPPSKRGKKGQQQKGQGKPKGKRVPPGPAAEANGEAVVVDKANDLDKGTSVDAAQLDDVAVEMKNAVISDSPAEPLPTAEVPTPTEPTSTELPLVEVPLPQGDEASASQPGEYFIRAVQGHSIKLESVAHLEALADDEASRAMAGELVHGTRWELFETLKKEGLSRMTRQHVHLAPALKDHQIVPRPTSTLLIYLDLGKLVAAGIPVYASSNGVVLTPGDENGVVRTEYWRKAERVEGSLGRGGARTIVWEAGGGDVA